MKKTVFILSFFLLASHPAWALDADGRTEMGPAARTGYVMMRGVANIAGSPFEIPGTFAREYEMHPRLWPVTWFPRFFRNALVRVSSTLNDILIFPFAAPFTNDLTPFSEAYDLPEYPWKKE